VNALATIITQAAAKNLPLLLAGGHAVIMHGYPRNTFDLDLIIRRSDRTEWTAHALSLGYSLYREGPTFLQFNPLQSTASTALPLDLMLVNEDTFAKLWAESVPGPTGATGARVVSLRHLLALKCHAIKHGHPGRVVKDADDVLRLVQANGLDLNDSAMHELWTEPKNSMKESSERSPKRESAELVLPDWDGMDDSAGRVHPAAAFDLCEQYPALFPELIEKWRSQRPEKCLIEFVL